MSTDAWEGARNREAEVHLSSVAQIEEAVGRLDGQRHTLVILSGRGETHLAIGGGDRGRYVVYATFDNRTFFSLLGEGDPDRKVLMFVGGQDGDYPANTIVDAEPALAAARRFAETGELDPALRWAES